MQKRMTLRSAVAVALARSEGHAANTYAIIASMQSTCRKKNAKRMLGRSTYGEGS